jgi:hypothetical protein
MMSAFHTQSNAAVERFHRRLKDALRAWLASSDWPGHLPWILLGLQDAPREDSGISAAELVYGAPLMLPGPLVATAEPPLEDFVAKLHSGIPCVAPLPSPVGGPASSPPAHLATANFVYVRCPPAAPSLSPAYRSPYAVHKKAVKTFVLKIGGHFEVISVDRLKPHLGGPTAPASPPRRGGPPGSRRHP